MADFIWELPTGKRLLHIQETDRVSAIGRDRISVVCLSPKGKQLATANKSIGSVHVWEVATGKLLTTIPSDQEAERSAMAKLKVEGLERRKHLAYYYLAIEFMDNTRLRVQSTYITITWDTAKGQRVSVETHATAFHAGITKDLKRVLRSTWSNVKAGIRSKLQLWDTIAAKAMRGFSIEGLEWDSVTALSDYQRYLAVKPWNETEIALWDWQENKKTRRTRIHSGIEIRPHPNDGVLIRRKDIVCGIEWWKSLGL